MLSFPISPIGFHPSGCFPSGLHPSGCLPFGCYASNGLFLDVILFGTLPLDSILPVFSFWGFVLPCIYILSQHFIFARWDTSQRNALFFQQNINGNPLPCYATIRMLGALQRAPNKNIPTERAAIIIWRSWYAIKEQHCTMALTVHLSPLQNHSCFCSSVLLSICNCFSNADCFARIALTLS